MGFIQKLPTQLISAFRATLEELESADLLLHVVDASSPAAAAQGETVLDTLAGLKLTGRPVLTVLNKADQLKLPDGSLPGGESDLARLDGENPAHESALAHKDLPHAGTLVVSALRGWGIDALRERLVLDLFGERPPPLALAASS